MSLPTLYQLDSKGKARQWRVWTEGATIVVEHGIQNGKLQEKRTKAKPKNIGKVNETTAEEQALREAQSKWNAQKDREDYHEEIEKAGRQTRPMLALDYRKVPHRVRWDDVIVQPKLNGHRLCCGYRYAAPDHYPEGMERSFEMMTRKGESHCVDHLRDPADLLLVECNEILSRRGLPTAHAVDGETYKHGWTLPQIASRSKKYYRGETELLEFHAFDLVVHNVPFLTRYTVLEEAIGGLQDDNLGGGLALVPVHKIVNEEQLIALHGEFLEQLYEGIIIRHAGGFYRNGDRSPDLFKYKIFFDEETKIINVWEDLNGLAMFTCQRKSGKVVKVTPKRSHEERREMLARADEWVGQWITTQYQSETPDGSLEFPVGLDIRECDEDGEALL